MKLGAFLISSAAALAVSDAFSPVQQSVRNSNVVQLRSSKQSEDSWQNQVGKILATGLVTASLWAAPATTILQHNPYFDQLTSSSVANAKQMASASGSRVNKDPESLLRYGLPINSKEARKLQGEIEAIKQDVGTKRKAAALDHVRTAKRMLNDANLIKACRDGKICTSIVEKMSTEIEPISAALKDSMETLNGSEQERQALDKAYVSQDRLSKLLTSLEEQMIPENYEVKVPSAYDDLPQLKKRATVEMVFKKPNNEPFDVNGQNYKEAKMKMVIDGYTSPVTGGNFVDLVLKGFYNNMEIQRSDGFVVQTGDPAGEADGYVGTAGKALGAGKHGERLIPLEIFVVDDKAPTYEVSIEEDGRGGQATVLPFSAYGAMGWAREEYDPNSGSSQFFWLLFDSDLTPAGKNVLDGNYPCFGYVVEGEDFLRDIKEGDTIVSAKVTEGKENLVQPK
ncbi:cis-trans isomerase [Seminavis robusta]|uniref:peptidylprolyl isomerase n=1 Tax=Seminavis robusta TaxID=568900 RepID=A0A9N8HA30_9STRA|nr:cis-trans isomerase [Seminavis robusta]|eukprot:Sro211_g087950.1 cis-trans isomerase (453) ;mRNA; f:46717-48407